MTSNDMPQLHADDLADTRLQMINIGDGDLSIKTGSPTISGEVAGVPVEIPTARLLAMIDAADPDAMRAYLRETAPEVIADLYRTEIPEADSPEDVDESLAEQIDPQNIVRAGVLLALSQELTARAGNMIDGLDR